ncbi:ATP-dependent DNA helicase [Treponema phagedenis]|uniref:AAA family ATPase n=1 Tax=Treponema phagedenis TaxID=162 RepID=A0AAE6M845_TREPH|nr:UvrD-helicase domain-containing protein [Treponema phagedenis]QEJ96158.1 AAA family ATPase [Treponema phagedenis]QEJ99496.1 AAA family ATPase [Treponema phagedenis]QSI00454.1 ATP-dependent DNA helicase [Treponema phagedenis]
MSGKLYIAGAGAGKTTKIVKDAIATKHKKNLITTHTIANAEQIKNKIREQAGVIPENITVKTWFSFLLEDGIRPYQGAKFTKRIAGISFINGQSAGCAGKQQDAYYINKDNKIYSDKISAGVMFLDDDKSNRDNNKSLIFERLSKKYDCVYIDEVQDLVGYDLDIIARMIKYDIEVIMAGDPRQCTYKTHYATKNKRYSNGKIEAFFKNECKNLNITIDDKSLNKTYRNCKPICDFANEIYKDISLMSSEKEKEADHCGVFIIREEYVEQYLEKFRPVQLRCNILVKINSEYVALNLGESKGLEFDRVLIYPTENIWRWIFDSSIALKPGTRADFYVAITRARYSVAIVEKKIKKQCPMTNKYITYWEPDGIIPHVNKIVEMKTITSKKLIKS